MKPSGYIKELNGFKLGDSVTFTNDYGVRFENLQIIAIADDSFDFYGSRFFLLKDSYWFPIHQDQIKHAAKTQFDEATEINNHTNAALIHTYFYGNNFERERIKEIESKQIRTGKIDDSEKAFRDELIKKYFTRVI